MQDMMPVVIDLVVVAIVAGNFLRYYRRGFVSSLMLFLGFLASVCVSFAVSSALAKSIYDGFLQERVLELLSVYEPSLPAADNKLVDSIVRFLRELPPQLLGVFGVTDADILKMGEYMQGLAGSRPLELARTISDNVVAPIVTTLLSSVLFLFVFTVLIFVVRRLAGTFTLVGKIPLVGPVDKLLGGVLGLGSAAMELLLLSVLASLFLAITADSVAAFNHAVIEKTMLFSWFMELNPLIGVYRLP